MRARRPVGTEAAVMTRGWKRRCTQARPPRATAASRPGACAARLVYDFEGPARCRGLHGAVRIRARGRPGWPSWARPGPRRPWRGSAGGEVGRYVRTAAGTSTAKWAASAAWGVSQPVRFGLTLFLS